MKKPTLLAAVIAVASSTLFVPQFSSSAKAASTSCGRASWYALTSRTASGERMNPDALTAAHKTLKLGSQVKVTNLNNGRSVVVRINDRGPFVKGRVIDLSKGAAKQLGFIGAGHTDVQIDPIDGSSSKSCA